MGPEMFFENLGMPRWGQQRHEGIGAPHREFAYEEGGFGRGGFRMPEMFGRPRNEIIMEEGGFGRRGGFGMPGMYGRPRNEIIIEEGGYGRPGYGMPGYGMPPGYAMQNNPLANMITMGLQAFAMKAGMNFADSLFKPDQGHVHNHIG